MASQIESLNTLTLKPSVYPLVLKLSLPLHLFLVCLKFLKAILSMNDHASAHREQCCTDKSESAFPQFSTSHSFQPCDSDEKSQATVQKKSWTASNVQDQAIAMRIQQLVKVSSGGTETISPGLQFLPSIRDMDVSPADIGPVVSTAVKSDSRSKRNSTHLLIKAPSSSYGILSEIVDAVPTSAFRQIILHDWTGFRFLSSQGHWSLMSNQDCRLMFVNIKPSYPDVLCVEDLPLVSSSVTSLNACFAGEPDNNPTIVVMATTRTALIYFLKKGEAPWVTETKDVVVESLTGPLLVFERIYYVIQANNSIRIQCLDEKFGLQQGQLTELETLISAEGPLCLSIFSDGGTSVFVLNCSSSHPLLIKCNMELDSCVLIDPRSICIGLYAVPLGEGSLQFEISSCIYLPTLENYHLTVNRSNRTARFGACASCGCSATWIKATL